MLVVKNDLSVAVYSVGKTGSTSLLNAIDDQWQGVGESSADFMRQLAADYYDNLYKDRVSAHIDQFSAVDHLGSAGTKIYCIVRNPWRRYVSGIKEIVQDSVSSLGEDMFRTVWQHLMTNPVILEEHINRLFYLSEYKSANSKPLFAIHDNYHVRNWLHEVEILVKKYNAEIVLSDNLDKFISSLSLVPGPHQNVSFPGDIVNMESAIVNSSTYRNSLLIADYVNTDIEIFNNLMPDHCVKKLIPA